MDLLLVFCLLISHSRLSGNEVIRPPRLTRQATPGCTAAVASREYPDFVFSLIFRGFDYGLYA